MRAMAEAAKVLHTDKEVVLRVLSKYLRIRRPKGLDQAYNAEIKALEPRMELKLEVIQAILDDIAFGRHGRRSSKLWVGCTTR
jgi:hypothetical protein